MGACGIITSGAKNIMIQTCTLKSNIECYIGKTSLLYFAAAYMYMYVSGEVLVRICSWVGLTLYLYIVRMHSYL